MPQRLVLLHNWPMWGLDQDEFGGELQQPTDYWQDDFHLAPWYGGGIPRLLPQAIKSRMLTLEVRDPAQGNATLQKIYLWPAEAALEILDFIDGHNRFDKPYISINIVSAGVLAPPFDGRQPAAIYRRAGPPRLESSSDTAVLRQQIASCARSLGPQMLVHFVFFKGIRSGSMEREVLDINGTPQQRAAELSRYRGYFVGAGLAGGLYLLYVLLRLMLLLWSSRSSSP